MAETLDMEEVIEQVAEYEGWEQDGPWLTKAVQFSGFVEAIDFVNDVASIAEDIQHHPHIVVENHDTVVLSVTTHDAGGITERDFEFVDRVEQLLE